MSIASFLRFCFCSFLIICLALDTTAQRAGRRRSVAVEKTVTIPVDTVVPVKECVRMVSIEEDQLELEEEIILPPDCRETNSINKANIADAYPYLSGDGLRLYFTSSRKVNFSRLYISTRKSINDPFGEPEILSPEITEGFFAGSLTADELTICMVKSRQMYISIRNSLDEKFPAPVLLKGTGDDAHFGPSISPDGKEILVNIGGNDLTRMYKRTGKYQVGSPVELPLPANLKPGPGQFSKDGLSYYLGVETPGYSREKSAANYHLWYYSRASLDDNFSSNPQELSEQMEGLKNILQPSLSSDGSILVFVTSPGNLWEDDDILLVNLSKKETVQSSYEFLVRGIDVKRIDETDTVDSIPLTEKLARFKDYVCEGTIITLEIPFEFIPENDDAKKAIPPPPIFHVKVYPNPFATSIRIEVGQLPAGGALLNLYDITGRKMRQEQINNSRTTLSLDRLTPGTYSYQLLSRKGELLSSGNLVKAE